MKLITECINEDAGPGVPLCQLNTKNDELIANHAELVIEAVIARLNLLSKLDCGTMTPKELLESGAVDPVRIFIKNEPHSMSKVQSERWRIISSVSLIDQLIERLLFAKQNKTEIKNWRQCPSAPGLGLSLDKDLADVWNIVNEHAHGTLKGNAAEADVTGFDWSVQEWELLDDAEMRCRLMSADAFTRKIIMNRVHCLCRTVYCTSTGRLIAQTTYGVQLSGSYNTSSTNSRIRVYIAMHIGALWAFAMGDDCVEDPVDDAPAKYAQLGHALKFYQVCDETFEFCSNVFSATTAYPVDGTKTLYRAMEQRNWDPIFAEQFRREMQRHPRLQEFMSVLAEVYPQKVL